MVAAPSPSTAAAGSKLLASAWNADVRDAVQYFLDNIGGLGARNGIYNSHADIWQRGTSFAITSSATPQYTADRYCTRRNGATGATVSRQTGPVGQQYAMRIQRDAGNANTTAIETWQALDTPDSTRFAGKEVQLMVALKAGANFSAASGNVTLKVITGTGTNEAPAATWTGTNDAFATTQAITTTTTDYVFDGISIPSSATQVKFYIAFTPVGTASTNDWVEVSAVQLVEGSAPGWERLSVGEHLRRCQRHYYQLGPYGASRVYAVGSCYSSTLAQVFFKPPVTMRATPTVTVSAVNDFNIFYAAGTANTTSLVQSAYTSADMIHLDATVASGLTAGQVAMLGNTQDTTNGAIYVSAEL